MELTPRKALFKALSSVPFLLASIFLSIAAFFVKISAEAPGYDYLFGLSLSDTFLEMPIGALVIVGVWLVFGGAKKENVKLMRAGFLLFSIFSFIIMGLMALVTIMCAIMFAIAGSSVMLFGHYIESAGEFVILMLAFFVVIVALVALLFLFLRLALVPLSFRKALLYNRSVAKYPTPLAVIVIIFSAFSILDSYTAELGIASSFTLAAGILIMVVLKRYIKDAPLITKSERAEFERQILTEEGRRTLILEADRENPVENEEKTDEENTEEFPPIDLAVLKLFEKEREYGPGDRFRPLVTLTPEKEGDPVVVSHIDVYRDSVSENKLLRLRFKNLSAEEASRVSFTVILGDGQRETLGAKKFEAVECAIAPATTAFDENAVVLPESVAYGVVKIDRIDFVSGLSWTRGSDYYRFQIS